MGDKKKNTKNPRKSDRITLGRYQIRRALSNDRYVACRYCGCHAPFTKNNTKPEILEKVWFIIGVKWELHSICGRLHKEKNNILTAYFVFLLLSHFCLHFHFVRLPEGVKFLPDSWLRTCTPLLRNLIHCGNLTFQHCNIMYAQFTNHFFFRLKFYLNQKNHHKIYKSLKHGEYNGF